MRIVEYQSKGLCELIGIPIPRSKLILSANSPINTLSGLQFPVVLKAQVTAINRGKYGGVCLAKDLFEANDLITKMFLTPIMEMHVPSILAEELIEFEDAYSINLAYDQTCCELILSGAKSISSNKKNGDYEEGGSEIFKLQINPLLGITPYQIDELSISLGIDKKNNEKFSEILQGLWQLFNNYDATYIDLSPLVIDSFQDFYVLGIQLEVDDSALFRVDEICKIVQFEASTRKIKFWQLGCEYQYLQGKICIAGNDLQHCLLINDVLSGEHCSIGEMIGVGENLTSEKIASILDLLLIQPETKSIFFNLIDNIDVNKAVIDGIYQYYFSHPDLPPLILLYQGEKIDISLDDSKTVNVQIVNSYEDAIRILQRAEAKES